MQKTLYSLLFCLLLAGCSNFGFPGVYRLDIQQGNLITQDQINQLKPGMTAEARIRVGELKNVLVVPVQAIAEHKGDFFAFVEDPLGNEIRRRKVKIGENNEKLVEVLEGIQEGETVALDAHARAALEFKNEDAKEGEGEKPAENPPTTPQTKSP